jgi:ABC-2 type transport system ATP-binding protein
MIESPSLYNHLSGRANLEIFALYYSIDKKRIEEVLEIVGLTESAHKIVKRYSLGMKQRLGIAICLLHDPDLLILDEPLNGLDPHGIAEIRHLLIKLCKEEGKTIFVSSHLLSEIESTCDFIGIISKGKLLFQGKIDDLKNAQAGKMVYSLETSNVDLTMLQLNQMNGLTCSTFDNKITVEVENKEEIAQVVKSLVTNGVDLYSVQRKENNLEDLFLELTK